MEISFVQVLKERARKQVQIIREATSKNTFYVGELFTSEEKRKIDAYKKKNHADTLEGQKKIIYDAKARKPVAINTVFIESAYAIKNSFFNTFLGRNASPKVKAARIEAGDWEEWIGIAYETLLGNRTDSVDARSKGGYLPGTRNDDREAGNPLDTFDPSKYKTGDELFTKFGYYFKRYLDMIAKRINSYNNASGISGVDNFKLEAKALAGDKTGSKNNKRDSLGLKSVAFDVKPSTDSEDYEVDTIHGLKDETAHAALDSIEDEDFWDNFADFANDENLRIRSSKMDDSAATCLIYLIKASIAGVTSRDGAAEMMDGVTRGTYGNRIALAKDIISDYDIDLSRFIQKAGDKDTAKRLIQILAKPGRILKSERSLGK